MRRLHLFLLLVGAPATLAAQAKWQFAVVPALDLPGTTASGEIRFGVVTSALRLSTGDIVIADGASSALVAFSPSGQQKWKSGREGEGPGEYRMLWWIGRTAGDSVMAMDLAGRRITVVAPDGKFGRQFMLAPAPALMVTDGAGRVAWVAGNYGGPPVERARGSLHLRERDGTERELRKDFGVADFVLGQGPAMPQPLGRGVVIALARDAVLLGTADSAVIERVPFDGSPGSAVRIPYTPRPPNEAERLAGAQALLDRFSDPKARELMRPRFEKLPGPKLLPPYFGLWVDRQDQVWVLRTPPHVAPMRFTVLDGAGRVVAEVTSPLAVAPHELGPDYLLGSREDEAGEPHLVLLRRAP